MIFLSAFAIAFSGAIMPGPLLTYSIRQLLNHGPRAGFIIIAGHAVLEIFVIAFIFLGFDAILQSGAAQTAIGIVGGLLLAYMGIGMIVSSLKNKIKIELDGKDSSSKSMFLSGIVISAANPYFLLWWAVIGLGFLLRAYKSFGAAGVLFFYLGHASADFFWYGLISFLVGTSRKFIEQRVYRIIMIALGCLLIYFGGGFFYSAIVNMV